MDIYRRADSAPSDGGDGRCELLGPFALFVQGALGLLALLSLVYKRAREHPQRPLQIWFFDVSKQVIGSTMVHVANILLSLLSSGSFSIDPPLKHPKRDGEQGGDGGGGGGNGKMNNPCSFYLLNLLIDTTVGILILIWILRLINKLLFLTNNHFLTTGIQSGYYGNPPQWTWWVKQSTIYFMGLMGMKMVVYLMFALFPFLGAVGDWMLGWTEGDRRLQVFFVMFFFPLVMNAFQYYVIDSFIKDNTSNLGFTQLDGSTSSPRASSSSFHRRLSTSSFSSTSSTASLPKQNQQQSQKPRPNLSTRPVSSPASTQGGTVQSPAQVEYMADSDASEFLRNDHLDEERVSGGRSGSVPLRSTRRGLSGGSSSGGQ